VAARKPDVVFDTGTSIFRGFVPRAPLRDAVELVWTTSGPAQPGVERVLPNGVVELIFNLGAPQRVVHSAGRFTRYRAAWVAGIQSRPLDIESELDSELVGVRFRPGGAAPLLGLPAHAIAGSVVELAELHIDWAEELRDRLLEARDATDRALVAERALTRQLLRGQALDPRVAAALEAMRRLPAGLSLAALAGQLGVSHKHLIALFKREVGVSPKMLQRVLRFQGALQALQASPAPHVTQVAHDCGYADQAHLNHDFRALAGVTPRAYLQRRLVDPNHVGVE
jgi:AraC-like DNA-binding protein